VICPTTERNLGDGLPDLERLRRAGASLAIGTDSHARIDPFAELRGLEDGERLRALRRVVLQDDEGRVGPTLLTAGTRGGARSLALSAGEIESGLRGDLVAIDLSGAEWDGLHDDPTALLGALWLTGSGTLVRHVWVMGMKVVDDGWHPARDALRPHWARLIHEMR
jgi:cytosine/adenosine deaminase-related metal-dependent hydrolase